jgi:hypothetical protein
VVVKGGRPLVIGFHVFTHRKVILIMALNTSAQPSRNGLLMLLATRARGVLQDRDFQQVLRHEGWRFLVAMTTEARAAWVRAGRP